mmetsp:Transcript_4842/g.11812  ORF Transcript_4842/g.11812 Transcript_4842/m.11812 type:complete len:248 (-) Transcript_4842:270-1013(-)
MTGLIVNAKCAFLFMHSGPGALIPLYRTRSGPRRLPFAHPVPPILHIITSETLHPTTRNNAQSLTWIRQSVSAAMNHASSLVQSFTSTEYPFPFLIIAASSPPEPSFPRTANDAFFAPWLALSSILLPPAIEMSAFSPINFEWKYTLARNALRGQWNISQLVIMNVGPETTVISFLTLTISTLDCVASMVYFALSANAFLMLRQTPLSSRAMSFSTTKRCIGTSLCPRGTFLAPDPYPVNGCTYCSV